MEAGESSVSTGHFIDGVHDGERGMHREEAGVLSQRDGFDMAELAGGGIPGGAEDSFVGAGAE